MLRRLSWLIAELLILKFVWRMVTALWYSINVSLSLLIRTFPFSDFIVICSPRFNVYIAQPEVKPGCILRRSNFNVLEQRRLVSKSTVRLTWLVRSGDELV